MNTDQVILLVEDNRKDEELTHRALKKAKIGNRVAVVRDGAEALEYLHGTRPDGTKNELPHLILLDIKLPKVDGHQVLQRIRADDRTRLIPVVLLTTSNEDSDRFKGYSLGANSFVRKPVDFAQFAQAVMQLGLYWLVLNDPPPATRAAEV